MKKFISPSSSPLTTTTLPNSPPLLMRTSSVRRKARTTIPDKTRPQKRMCHTPSPPSSSSTKPKSSNSSHHQQHNKDVSSPPPLMTLEEYKDQEAPGPIAYSKPPPRAWDTPPTISSSAGGGGVRVFGRHSVTTGGAAGAGAAGTAGVGPFFGEDDDDEQEDDGGGGQNEGDNLEHSVPPHSRKGPGGATRRGRKNRGYDDEYNDDKDEEKEGNEDNKDTTTNNAEEGTTTTAAAGGGAAAGKEVFLSVVVNQDKMGIAAYDCVTTVLHVAEVFVFQADMAITIQQLKFWLSPTLILVPSRMVGSPALNLLTSSLEDSGDLQENCYESRIMKNSLFDYGKSVKAIERLEVTRNDDGEDESSSSGYLGGGGAESGITTSRERHLNLSSVLDFESHAMVQAIGGLLGHLPSTGFAMRNGRLSVYDIQPFQFADYLSIDKLTLEALQIFKNEAHPSVVKGRGKSKEGFSLYGILDRTWSILGRAMLREWMLKPLTNMEVITDRHASVECLLRGECSSFVEEVGGHLRKVKDSPKIVFKIRTVCARVKDWSALYQSVLRTRTIRSMVAVLLAASPHLSSTPIFRKVLFQARTKALTYIHDMLLSVIDFDQSETMDTLVIKPGVCPELDELRSTYDDMDDFLTNTAREQLQCYPTIAALYIEYLPQVGYVIALGTQLSQNEQETLGLEHLFEREGTFYFKNQRMLELDEEIGDIHGEIVDTTKTIVRQLEEKLLEYESEIHSAALAMAELDCLVTFAVCARDYNYSRPEIVPDNVCYISKGRHPLQELCVESYIPNDTVLAPMKEGGINVVTGPNFSGKSVFLKQAALIQYMAQIGCFVPADRAVLGVVDRIRSRIQSFETVSLSQSTFTIDLNQVSSMLRDATPRSLLLIDEFGKGTSVSDGIALLAATIRFLSAMKEPPRTIITTHFLEIFRFGLLSVDSELKSTIVNLATAEEQLREINIPNVVAFKMDVLVQRNEHNTSSPSHEQQQGRGGGSVGTNNGADRRLSSPSASTSASSLPPLSSVVPLFQLAPGIADSSYGIHCARVGGIPEHVLKRAQEVCRSMTRGVPITKKKVVPGGGGSSGGGGGAVSPEENPEYRDIVNTFLSTDNYKTCPLMTITNFMKKLRV